MDKFSPRLFRPLSFTPIRRVAAAFFNKHLVNSTFYEFINNAIKNNDK